MTKLIKVNNTATHELRSLMGISYSQLSANILIAEGKLVLIPAKEDALLAFNQHTGKYYIIPNKGDRLKTPCDYFKPIIISETERIEEGDKVLKPGKIGTVISGEEYQREKPIGSGEFRKGEWCTVQAGINFKYPKILALPEHFSIEQLQMIVDGKLKDGDKVLVECEDLSQVAGRKDTSWANIIKLDTQSHITLYPAKEKKVFTKEDMRKMVFRAYNLRTEDKEVRSTQLLLEWFEENIE